MWASISCPLWFISIVQYLALFKQQYSMVVVYLKQEIEPRVLFGFSDIHDEVYIANVNYRKDNVLMIFSN